MAKTSPPAAHPSRAAGKPPPVNGLSWFTWLPDRDDAETERAAIRDLRELQRFGSTEAVKVVVQLDRTWPGIPERYVVTGEPARLPEDLNEGARRDRPPV